MCAKICTCKNCTLCKASGGISCRRQGFGQCKSTTHMPSSRGAATAMRTKMPSRSKEIHKDEYNSHRLEVGCGTSADWIGLERAAGQPERSALTFSLSSYDQKL